MTTHKARSKTAEIGPSGSFVPPRRGHRVRLVVVAVLLFGWFAFLIWQALDP